MVQERTEQGQGRRSDVVRILQLLAAGDPAEQTQGVLLPEAG